MIDMAHYAFLDSNNIVTEVIPGKNEGEDNTDWEEFYGNVRGQICKRTSYNGNIRKNYAGIGYTYREDIDAFVPPQPFPSWTLDSNAQWQPPVAMPTDGSMYSWNEANQAWEVVSGS